MTLIDQRILIDAPQEVVWEFITQPDHIAQWHTDYAGISVLTTEYIRAGTRRRCALNSGAKDIIEEITATVNGIGYEYTIIEGGAYGQFLARFRLQAGPDGTSVQWTIDYKPRGFIGLITDRLRGKRQIATMMAASLRQLRHRVDQHGVRMDADYRERVGMRDRLDFNERAQYQRRHAPPPGIDPVGVPEQPVDLPSPTDSAEVAELVEASAPPQPIEPTPSAPPASGAPPTGAVPSFVNELIQEEGEAEHTHKADTQPRVPEGLREAIEQQSPPAQQPAPPLADPAVEPPPPSTIEPPVPTDSSPPVEGDHTRATPPRGTAIVQPGTESPAQSPANPYPDVPVTPFVAPQIDNVPPQPSPPTPASPIATHYPERSQISEPRSITDDQPQSPADDPPTSDPMPPTTQPDARDVGEFAPVDQPATFPPQTPMTDTGEISIWEVFGVNRPSEEDTQTLTEFVQTVREREQTERAREIADRHLIQPTSPHPVRLRVRAKTGALGKALGLRLHLALKAAGVRIRKPFC